MCEEIADGFYTIPEVGIDVDHSLVLFLALTLDVSMRECVYVSVSVCV